jgi:Tol biopolymer transport system component
MKLPATLALLVGVAACDNLFNLQHVGAGRDAMTDVTTDSSLGPFGTPQPVGDLNIGATFSDDPALTADELEIVFTTDAPGTNGSCDLFFATRTKIDAPWSIPSPLPGLVNDAACQSGATLSPDGLELWYTVGGDIYFASRATRGGSFSAGVKDVSLSSVSSDQAPSVQADLLTMVLSRDTTGSFDLYSATRADTPDPWGAATAISELVTAADERSPFITDDGLAIWFSAGLGTNNDIYVASRATTANAFGPATRVDELSTPDRDDDPWVSPDGHRVYFSRYDSTGTGAIYMATR